MTPKKIKDYFESDYLIIKKIHQSLPIAKIDKYDDIIAWVSDYSRMLTGEYDDLSSSIDSKKIKLLPIDKNGSIVIYTFLESYLESNNYKLSPNDLKKSINLFQDSNPLKICELMFVPIALRLTLFHRVAEILEKIYIGKANRTEAAELKNAILSFLTYKKINHQTFFEDICLVEKIFNKDPSKIYPSMDFVSRNSYRNVIEDLSLRSGKSEIEIAEKVLSKATTRVVNNEDRHIGTFLFAVNRSVIEKEIGYKRLWYQKPSRLIVRSNYYSYFLPYLAIVALGLVSIMMFLLGVGLDSWKVIVYLLLLLVPTIIVAEDLINYISSKIVKPKALLRMDFRRGIPISAKTMLVVPTQLGTTISEPEELCSQLESNYLNNQTKNLHFALLLAFRDSKEKQAKASIEEEANLQRVKDSIEKLNQKYAKVEPIFFVFFRSRQWNEKENTSIEWERKRGKIVEFNRLLRGGVTSFDSNNLDYNFLSKIKYVITIDQGDLLPKDMAQKLVSTIAHPLNKAKIDSNSKIVKSGYGLIQPQMLCRQYDTASLLEMTFGDDKSWTSYSGVASNIYQDLFGHSIFMGKGIYDVDVLNQVLDHRLPENTVLSHDHLEGFYVRTGYASDIQIIEDSPVLYSSYITRLTRWTRGDFQNTAWLFNQVKNESNQKVKNPLGFFEKYKLLENILRSLFFPSIFVMLLFVVMVNDTADVGILSFAIGFLIFKPLLSLIDFVLFNKITLAWKEYLRSLFGQVKLVFLQIIFRIIFLGHLSFLTIITLTKAAYRLFISKRHLLEWQIFSHVSGTKPKKLFGISLGGFYGFEIFCISIILLKSQLGGLNLFSIIFFILMLTTPIWAEIFSSKRQIEKKEKHLIDQDWFNRLALKTWRYFEETVSQRTNYLPPDRLQVDVEHLFSRMTSITNIGLYLLSLQTASKLGFVPLDEYLSKSQNLFKTLGRMDKLNGHYYNWYNIKTLEALPPKYVSSVDSGNFVASLMTAENIFKCLGNDSICSTNFWNTLRAVLTLCLGAIENKGAKVNPDIKKDRQAILSLIYSIPNGSIGDVRLFYDNLRRINKLLFKHLSLYTKAGKTSNLRYWASKSLNIVNSKLKEIEQFYPWIVDKKVFVDPLLHSLEQQANLNGLREKINIIFCSKSLKPDIKKILNKSLIAIDSVLAIAENLSNICKNIYNETDFKFIYDKQQKLFYVAYDSVNKRFDKYHYGSLGSEARLTSFVSMALNQISIEHWDSLSRNLAASNGKLVMLSWGGSLFEYLFPQIFMNSVHESFTNKVLKSAVLDHISFARQKGIPWGISESCYNQKNNEGDYQYSIHGVPFLSTLLTHDQNTVVSPYSSLLALELFPKQTYKNLRCLERAGASGKFGFYEAVDYNRPVNNTVLKGKPVQAFLSHHQSIILLSIYNYLSGGGLRDSFSNNLAVKSLDFVLSEKVPVPAKIRLAQDIAQDINTYRKSIQNKIQKVKIDFSQLPLINLISNGNYRMYLTSRGGGYSQYRNIDINPWRADPTLCEQGNHIYIWDTQDEKLAMSVSPILPQANTEQTYEVSNNKVNFYLDNEQLAVKLTVGLMDGEDLEYRILSIKNMTFKAKTLKVAYSNEQIFSNGLEDITHPSFNRLRTKADYENNTWVYSKRQITGQPSIYTGHKSFIKHSSVDSVIIPSRRDFVGRLPEDLSYAVSSNEQKTSVSSYGLTYGNVTEISLNPLSEEKIIYLSTASFSRKKVMESMSAFESYNDFSKKLKLDKDSNKQNKLVDYKIEQKILSLLLYRRPTNEFTSNKKYIGLPDLRNRIRVSSDRPILLTRFDDKTPESSFRQLILYAQSLANKGFKFNLVILILDSNDYFNSNLDFVQKLLVETAEGGKSVDRFENLILIKEDEHSSREIESLKLLSTFYVDLNSGSLISQVESEYKKL